MLLRCAVGGNLYRPNIVRDIRDLAIIEDRLCLLVGRNRSVPAYSIKLSRSLTNHVILTGSGELAYLSSSTLSQSVKRDTPCNQIILVKSSIDNATISAPVLEEITGRRVHISGRQ